MTRPIRWTPHHTGYTTSADGVPLFVSATLADAKRQTAETVAALGAIEGVRT